MNDLQSEAISEVREKVKKEDLEKQFEYRQLLVKNPRLKYLFIELTDRCNLACLHCGSKCSNSNGIYIDADLIIKTLKTVADDFDKNNIMICLTGGEPLLHPDFVNIIEEINRLGFTWGITTNATLIDSDMAKKLKLLKMGSISISIDGLRDTHNWFRGAKDDNYQKAIDAIHYLKENGYYAQVTTVVHKKNISELESIYQKMLKLQIKSWRVVNIEPIGRSIEQQELMLDNQDMRYLLDFIREKRVESGKTGMDVCYGCSHYLTTAYERDVRDWCFICGSGLFVASILCNGDIYSCLDIERRPELIQGNIRYDRFSDIWFNKFQEFRKDRTIECDECKECSERKYCFGDSMHTWDFDEKKPKLCIKNILEEEI